MNFFLLIIIAVIINIGCFSVTSMAQKEATHTVYFENGQASISLGQLDAIKKIAKAAMSTKNGRVVVHSYANDAQLGDANPRLSGRRAYLVQQCLEREGISLAYMQVENKVRHSMEQEGCAACAEISLTTDNNFFFQNIYQENLANFLMEGSVVKPQTFWIKPFEDVLITTNEGVLIRVPKGSFATKDSSLIKLDVRFLKNKWDMLLHSLTTRSVQQDLLELNRAVYLDASQHGIAVEMKNNQHLTVVVPSEKYTDNSMLYEKEGSSWSEHKKSDDLKAGGFYGNESAFCNNSNNGLGLPNYDLPPAKPTYLVYDSMTIEQDEQLKTIQVRLDYLNEQKVDDKGKPKELSPQQKQNEYLLKNQKDRILIVKEKIKIKTREKNEETEQAYYTELAAYNKRRNAMQRSYINGLDSFGMEQKALAVRCEEYKKNIELLKQYHGQDVYEKIVATLRNQRNTEKVGYWLETNQLGWLSIGAKTIQKNENVVPYRVKSPASAYKTTAFLIFEQTQEIVLGETLDETDIVFWEVPDGKTAKLLAVTQEGDNFLVAFHDLVTSGDPIQLEFKALSIKEVLEQLKF